MKSRNPARPRSKLSFAVDRSEIDISSDWVQSIMRPPRRPSPAREEADNETATVEPVVPGAGNTTVEQSATGSENATVELFGETHAATVAGITPVADIATVAKSASVEKIATVDYSATGAVSAGRPNRALRLRPIRRITDGLTSGQFTVYTLMFEQAQPAGEGQGNRLYRGGYADLCRLSGLSKRGVQNVVAELLQKGVISIHRPPGYHKTETTVYSVPAGEAILSSWFRRGLCYAVGKSKRLINPATVDLSSTV